MCKIKEIEKALYEYKKKKIKVRNIELEINKIKNNYLGTSSVTFEERTAPTNKISNSVENEFLRKEDQISRLECEKIFIASELEQLDNAMETLDHREKEIIEELYFNKLKNKDISQKMYLSEVSIIKVKRSGLNKLSELLVF